MIEKLRDGSVFTESHTGEWFFDGINFKRKYTQLNDKPLSSSRMTYATYRMEQSSDDEIRCSDDIENRKVVYRRVAPGT